MGMRLITSIGEVCMAVVLGRVVVGKGTLEVEPLVKMEK
jgi:hypothetical protein